MNKIGYGIAVLGISAAIAFTPCSSDAKGFKKAKPAAEPPAKVEMNYKNVSYANWHPIYDNIKCGYNAEDGRVYVELQWNGKEFKGSFDPKFDYFGKNDEIIKTACTKGSLVIVAKNLIESKVIFIPYDRVSMLFLALSDTENDKENMLQLRGRIGNIADVAIDEERDTIYLLDKNGKILILAIWNGKSNIASEYTFSQRAEKIELQKDGSLKVYDANGAAIGMIDYLFNPIKDKFDYDVKDYGEAAAALQ